MSDLPPLPERAHGEEAGAGHRFPCAACGAYMRFDPVAGRLVCGHCGNTADIEGHAGPWQRQDAIREQDFEAGLRNLLDDSALETTQVHACRNCGATVEFDPGLHAAECPFCATPIVGEPGADRHIKPRALLPFMLDEAMARKAMTDWLGRLWFAPGGLQRYARKGRAMDGIYIPYWTFDADTTTDYTGERGVVHYETRRNSKGESQTVTRVHWTPRRGRVRRFFDDVLVPGSRTLSKPVLDALPPWDLSQLVPYAPEYLAGLRAETYNVALDEAFSEARARMDAIIARDVRFDIGGDRQRIHRMQTDVRDVTFKHVLLPVWVAVYRYQGKPYQILINGQSGRVQGARPWSVWKLALAGFLAVAVGLALAYGYAVTQDM